LQGAEKAKAEEMIAAKETAEKQKTHLAADVERLKQEIERERRLKIAAEEAAEESSTLACCFL
jgi:hypothetical protein